MGNPRGWLKLYYRVLDDEKIMSLDEADRWLWIELLCIAGEHDEDGFLPPLQKVAFRLHRTTTVPERLSSGLDRLVQRNLIDKAAGGTTGFRYRMHDWGDWQGGSSTSAERMKRHRERHNERHSDVTSRAPAKTDFKTDRQTDKSARTAREGDFVDRNQFESRAEKSAPVRPLPDESFQASLDDTDDALFEATWKAYSEEQFGHPGSVKGKAEGVWRTLSEADRRAALEGVIVWRLSEWLAHRDDDRPSEHRAYRKHLDTWLAGRMWAKYRIADTPAVAVAARRVLQRTLDEAGEQREAV